MQYIWERTVAWSWAVMIIWFFVLWKENVHCFTIIDRWSLILNNVSIQIAITVYTEFFSHGIEFFARIQIPIADNHKLLWLRQYGQRMRFLFNLMSHSLFFASSFPTGKFNCSLFYSNIKIKICEIWTLNFRLLLQQSL